MCGIFGQISEKTVNKFNLEKIARYAKQRGLDSSGLIYFRNNGYEVEKADFDIEELLKQVKPYNSKVVLGHSRLITNGLSDNQPVIKDSICVIHNGIIVNEDEIWKNLKVKRELKIDSEVIAAIASEHFKEGGSISDLSEKVLHMCRGILACAIVVPSLGKVVLFSNNGSLYVGSVGDDIYFTSEKYPLTQIQCNGIRQVKAQPFIFDIPIAETLLKINDVSTRKEDLIPKLSFNKNQKNLLQFESSIDLKRCTRCILPDTMPFIRFDDKGVCNYCHNYKKRNKPKPSIELFELVDKYRRPGEELECIVPFSGGRDSCYGLHLVVEELGMRPVTYTYDWGMVTDLGRRNISQMCGDMGVENIIVAANISKKRRNIKMNLNAWLKAPHLGMMAMLTAGDKHFFRHVETIKKQTGISLNLWGVNPLEATHFKTGFLGILPDFEEEKVYSNGIKKQFFYHSKRFKAMLQSPGYFNRSLWDTLSGEYYRSFTEKKDYFHIFDYYRWDENEVNDTLIGKYDWETAIDTSTTWRIGDGTAGFYNYVYYTVAGFTEHDTFRSNQIREGQLTRQEALSLVSQENMPRYQNIRWYLDVLDLDFEEVIKIVNSIPKLYRI
ncbi:glucosamine 6-phosphate synthetase [Amylibacter sp.]|nr:glucosamine 6-phosphate synthetase [Amylibacter sp.]